MKIKYLISKDNRVQDFNAFISATFPELLVENNPDVILVAGGDGAMHHAIQDNADFKGVFLGKGMGTLNFLMNTFENDFNIIRELKEDRRSLHKVKTHTISVKVNNKYLGEAVNDVIIGDSINSYFTFRITSQDTSFNDFICKGTGLCISTTLGSTAFNFNNHGPILPLESNLWSVTSVVCNKKVDEILEAQKMTITSNGGVVYLSGIEKFKLTENDTLVLDVGKQVNLGFLDEFVFQQKRVTLAQRYRG
jgi:NAD kinase